MRAAVLIASCWLAACSGPRLYLQNEGEHRVFVDGVETDREWLPYRYYGTTRWDSLPAAELEDGIPTFRSRPASQLVHIPPPASLWLFPIDFPIELFQRAMYGRPDQTTTIVVREKPPEEHEDTEIPDAEIGKLRERAQRARIQR